MGRKKKSVKNKAKVVLISKDEYDDEDDYYEDEHYEDEHYEDERYNDTKLANSLLANFFKKRTSATELITKAILFIAACFVIQELIHSLPFSWLSNIKWYHFIFFRFLFFSFKLFK